MGDSAEYLYISKVLNSHLSGLSKISFLCCKVYNSKATRKFIWGYHSLFTKAFGTSHVASVWATMLLEEQYDMEERGCSRAALTSCIGTVGPLGTCGSRAGQSASPTSMLGR